MIPDLEHVPHGNRHDDDSHAKYEVVPRVIFELGLSVELLEHLDRNQVNEVLLGPLISTPKN